MKFHKFLRPTFFIIIFCIAYSISASHKITEYSSEPNDNWIIIEGKVSQIEITKSFYKIIVEDSISGYQYLIVSERPVGNSYFYKSPKDEINRKDNIQIGTPYKFIIKKKHLLLEELVGVSADCMYPIPDYFGTAGQPFWPYVTSSLKHLKYIPDSINK